jgi:hypothetical protein
MEAISPETLRLSVMAAGALVLVASLYVAFSQQRLLRDVRISIFDHPPIPGRKPKSDEAVERRKRRIANFRKRVWLNLSWHFFLLILLGFIIPSVMLYFGALHYTWFDENHGAFISAEGGTLVAQPTEQQALLFVIGQFSKGALMDFMEVFDLSVGGITNDPDNWYFSSMVFLYRLFAGAFAAFAVFFLFHAAVIALALRFKARHSGASIAAA